MSEAATAGADAEGQTRLHHVLRIHACAPDSYAPYSAGLLQSIFAHTGAFAGPLMAELAAWWGSVPAHPTVMALLVRTYEHVLAHPMQTAQDLLQVAASAGEKGGDGAAGETAQPSASRGATGTSGMDETQDAADDTSHAEVSAAPAVDISAVLFVLIKEATSWCEEHGSKDTGACVVVSTYVADLIVRTMATRTSALLSHIVQEHFVAPLARSVPAVASVLAMLTAALRNVGHTAASASLTPSSAFTRADPSWKALPATGAAAAVSALMQRDAPSLVERVVGRVLAWGHDGADTSDLGDILTAALTTTGAGAHDLVATVRGALRVVCSFVVSANCLVGTQQDKERRDEASEEEQLAVAQLVLAACSTHTKAFLACLATGPSDDDAADAMKAAVRMQRFPRITCTLDLMWTIRGLATAVASAAYNGTGDAPALRQLWLRATIEDVNRRVQQFALDNRGSPGAGVGATRALSLLLPLCEADTTTPALARHGLGCLFGNLVQMVHMAQHKAQHCGAVMRGVLLPRVVSRSWMSAGSESSGGNAHTHVTAVDLGAGDAVRVAAGDVHRVLLLHVAASSQHVQELFGNWLAWLAETKDAPAQRDVMFLRAVLTSAKHLALTVLTDASKQLLLGLCAEASADTASTTDALLQLLELAAPAHFGVAVKKLPTALLLAYVTSITTQRARVVGAAVAARPTHAADVLALASSNPAVLENPLSRRIVAECALQDMHLPSVNLQSAHTRSLLSSRVMDQTAAGLWLWTSVARNILQAPPRTEAATVDLMSRLRLSVLRALKSDAPQLTWAEVLVSFVFGESDSGNKQGVDAWQNSASDTSPSRQVLMLLVRHLAEHRGGPASSPASLRAWVLTLTALLQSAIAAFGSIDRSLELVSQCFPCPLAAVLACQAASLLLDARHAAVSDEDLRVLQGREEASELLETINTFLQTVCGGVLVDLEPPIVQVCRLAYAIGHRVEVASGFNIILDAPRTAELFLHGVSIRRVLTFSENAPYQPPTPLSITKRRLVKAKEEALRFVRCVVEQQPQLMAGDLGHLVLDAYGGSLAPADVISLNLLLFAERNGMRLSRMLLITGPGTSSIRKAYLAKLMTEAVDPMAVEGLARLDAQRLEYTAQHVHHLPDTRSEERDGDDEAEDRAIETEGNSLSKESSTVGKRVRQPDGTGASLDRALAYDPLYVLPLLRSIATFGGQGCLFDFVEKQCARFCFVALSSPVRRVRLLASATLAAFANAVSKTKLKELQELKTTVQLFQNSVAEPGQQLPCIIATFAAECCQLSLHPTDLPMYPITMKFVASRPTLDLGDLPLFLNLFNSASMTHRKERVWMLRLLSSGCKTPLDLQLLKRRQAVDVAMSFYLSPLSDHTARVSILDFIAAVAAIEKGASYLHRCGTLAWLQLAVHLISSNEYITYFERLARLLLLLARVARDDSMEPTVAHLLSNLLLSMDRDSRLKAGAPTSTHGVVVDMLQDLSRAVCLGPRSKELLAALVHKLDAEQ